jgi:hypothetical protein
MLVLPQLQNKILIHQHCVTFNVLEKIRNLSKIFIPDNTIYTASIAFIAGYIHIKKTE